MRKNDSPCYKCDRRTLGCHSSCEEYKVFDVKNKALSKQRREIYTKNNDIDAVEFRFKAKIVKRKRNRK